MTPVFLKFSTLLGLFWLFMYYISGKPRDSGTSIACFITDSMVSEANSSLNCTRFVQIPGNLVHGFAEPSSDRFPSPRSGAAGAL